MMVWNAQFVVQAHTRPPPVSEYAQNALEAHTAQRVQAYVQFALQARIAMQGLNSVLRVQEIASWWLARISVLVSLVILASIITLVQTVPLAHHVVQVHTRPPLEMEHAQTALQAHGAHRERTYVKTALQVHIARRSEHTQ